MASLVRASRWDGGRSVNSMPISALRVRTEPFRVQRTVPWMVSVWSESLSVKV